MTSRLLRIFSFMMIVCLAATAAAQEWDDEGWETEDDVQPTQAEMDAQIIREERLIAFAEAFNDECPLRINDNLFVESMTTSPGNILNLTYKVLVNKLPDADQGRKDLFRAALVAGMCNNKTVSGIFRYADEMHVKFLDAQNQALGSMVIDHTSCQAMARDPQAIPSVTSAADDNPSSNGAFSTQTPG